jgi:hypothetical protein
LTWHPGKPLQVPDRGRERSLGGCPRLEEALGVGQQEAPLARLQVDDQLLEPSGGHQHAFGVPGQLQGVPLPVDGAQHRCEGASHDQREQAARDDHPGSQPSSRHQPQ